MIYNCPKCPRENLLRDEVVLMTRGNIWMCKKCYNEYRKISTKKYNNKPERKKKIIEYYKFKRYGITEIDYNKKLELQLNGCAICKQEFSNNRKIYIDHDHKTSKVRDLLCPRCNTVLGLVNDNENLIWDFLIYLKRHFERVA